ncbi:SpoIIE family protein phosphatase [Clostridium rectalis]|uniref:SpoIIE family protein phosphatase n=1 Tax=Clostridium rectalis TaxID=2040295 RepID=UPI000F63B0DA|nr:SpoIIE family protein phosphatase [Clostridium rectalis]
MSLFIDVSFHSLKKFGEELCGDMVEVIRLKDSTIIVLADGLGSGVKANILATLTSKISATMLKEGADIYETVDTIINTLPVCKVRKIAYSTFTLIKIYEDGRVYIVEYDNPPFFYMKNGNYMDIKKNLLSINERRVYESKFYVESGDIITIVSDGVVHAGLGNIMNLGWKWHNILDYLKRSTKYKDNAETVTKELIQTCFALYGGKPGDDATVVTIAVKEPQYIDLFTGPPKDKSKDRYVISEFIKGRGKKIICGGTAANIAERELKRKLEVNLNSTCKDIPPTASMKGIYLITEGVITLNKVIENLKVYISYINDYNKEFNLNEDDGASRLTRILIYKCTNITLWVGKAVNPAHQNPGFPVELGIKLKIVKELEGLLKQLGKKVEVKEI